MRDVAVGRDGPKDAARLGAGDLTPANDEMAGERARLGEARAYSKTTPGWSRAAAAQMMSGSSERVMSS
jgi:hypothetical protein